MADSMANEKEEQARKAHALAEKYFLAGDVSAARRLMQSAVRLAPDLPGTAQIVAAYDVHAAAARGRRNWYAVLGLTKSGSGSAHTHDDIKKQYRRLCLLVHPDKNPSAAADGAFKLIHAAWDALSAKHPPLGTGVTAPANQPRPPPPPQRKQAPPPRPPEPKPRPPKPQPKPPEPKPRPPKQKPPEPKQRPPKPEPKQKPPKPEPKPQEPKQKPPKPEQKPPKPEPKQKPPKPKWQPKPPKPKPEPKERPPKPQPQPKPQPKPKPQPQPRRRSASPEPPTSSSSQQENLKQDNRCSQCGAQSFNCRRNRCLSCQWSPMDGRRRHQPHDYDDPMHDAYEDDYDYDYAFNDFLNKEDDFFDYDAQGPVGPTELG